MAQHVKVILVDDVDGGEADETVTFALDGVTYEIDLTSANAAALRDGLATWIGHARRTGGRRVAASRRGPGRKDELQAMRDWGRANGFQVSDRGRVSSELQEAYKAAH